MSAETLRRVILNGDDFGYSPGVNRGIIDSLEKGILTSTSVMVRRAAAREAAQLVANKEISVGLHVDMTEEGFRTKLDWLRLFAARPKKIEANFKRQVEDFFGITKQLPHHIDGHHHIHLHPKVKPFVMDFAQELGIPVRMASSVNFVRKFSGLSTLQSRDENEYGPQKLISVIGALQPGTHEIMCHPGYPDEQLAKTGTNYLGQRALEVQALLSEDVRQFVDDAPDITLINWQTVYLIEQGPPRLIDIPQHMP